MIIIYNIIENKVRYILGQNLAENICEIQKDKYIQENNTTVMLIILLILPMQPFRKLKLHQIAPRKVKTVTANCNSFFLLYNLENSEKNPVKLFYFEHIF